MQHTQVDSYVPGAYRPFAAGSVEQAYADNKARIQSEEVAKAKEAKAAEEAKEAKAEKAKAAQPTPVEFLAVADGDDKEPEKKETAHDDKEVDADVKDTTKEQQQAGADDQQQAQTGADYAHKFLNEYAGDYVPLPTDTTNPKAWRDAFVSQYAEAYRHYMDASDRLRERFPHAPSSAAACHSMEQLKEWGAAQRMMIDSYVPKAYSSFSTGAVEQELKDSKARIKEEIAQAAAKADAEADQASTPATVVFLATLADEPMGDYSKQFVGDYMPMPQNTKDFKAWHNAFVHHLARAYDKYIEANDKLVKQSRGLPASPSDCHHMACLKQWRDMQHTQVDSYVPGAYRPFAAGSVEQAYADNKARIQSEEVAKGQQVKVAAQDTSAAKGDGSAPTVAAASVAASAGSLSLSLAAAAFAAAVASGVALAVALAPGSRGGRRGPLHQGLLAEEAPLAAAV